MENINLDREVKNLKAIRHRGELKSRKLELVAGVNEAGRDPYAG